jgi:methanogenic corrinoid protein MtbC1
MMLDQIHEAVMQGKQELVASLTRQAIDQKLPPKDLLGAMVRAMDEIGRQYQDGKAYVPQMLFASRAMKTG